MIYYLIKITPLGDLGPFNLHGLTLILKCLSNNVPGNVWVEITYRLANVHGCIVEVWHN